MAVAADADAAPSAVVVGGLTRAHRSAELAVLLPARLVDLRVREGELVSHGQVLAVLDDGVQQLRTEIARAAAASTIGMDLARVEMQRTARDREQLQALIGGDFATDKEFQDAQSLAETARLKFEEANLLHKKAVREKEREELLLARLHVAAPFAGYVAEIYRDLGETVEDSLPLLRLVQLDPLEVVLDCPLELTNQVREGVTVDVVLAGPVKSKRRGQVYFASRVADPASQTFKVKLLVDNPDARWMAGVKVVVDFGTAALSSEQAPRPDSAHAAGSVPVDGAGLVQGQATDVR
ncbi:MAG: efflux RND transporter periplasmic adaptor subunit [Phycisphaerae bacterium]